MGVPAPSTDHRLHSGLFARVDRYFGITARDSSFPREIRGGLATFFAMSYIVVLNPLIIGTVADADGNFIGGGQDVSASMQAVAGATALVAAVLTILMGVVGRHPFALAVGLGLNAFLAVAVASRMSWPEAMGLVVIEGLLVTVLVVSGVRSAVLRAIPSDLKTAMSAGIGLFIAFVGLVDAGFVRRVPDAAGTPVPVGLGVGGELRGWPTFVFVAGVLLMAVLIVRRVRGAILIGIALLTVVAMAVEAHFHPGPSVVDGRPVPTGWQLNVPALPDSLFGLPDLSAVGDVDVFGGFERIGLVAALMIVFALLLTDFFDTMGTVVGLGNEARLMDDRGQLPGIGRVLFVDAFGAVAGGAASTSSNTTYIESAAGVGEGARTGFASVVTGVLFLVAMFFTPMLHVVPFEAATPALVVVGLAMVAQLRRIDFADTAMVVSALLTSVLMPFTYSIANGLGSGLITYVVLRTCQGRAREVHPLLWTVAALFTLYFCAHPLRALLAIG